MKFLVHLVIFDIYGQQLCCFLTIPLFFSSYVHPFLPSSRLNTSNVSLFLCHIYIILLVSLFSFLKIFPPLFQIGCIYGFIFKLTNLSSLMPNSPYNEFFVCSWIYFLCVLLQFLFLWWDTVFAHSMIIFPLCPCVCVLVAQSCLTICDTMACSPPGSSAHGILQAVILEWVAIPFSRVSSHPRDWTWVFCIAGRFFTIWALKLFTLPFKVLLSSVNYQVLSHLWICF